MPNIVKALTIMPAIIVCRFLGNHRESKITAA